ncbi:MAG: hypothetical protein A2148_10590 [Chloroflexi bacterium RBG_16_68_14]|nr:MAG: hypothetical protein A2148_10590 [Chloroflexi bacterium RBG_16_68_14]
MPRAFLVEEGLDWDTLTASFWAWLREAHRAAAGEPADDRVSRMIAEQLPRIDAFIQEHGGGEEERFTLTTAMALLGVSYAATEKLAAALKERGLLEKPAKPSFDTLP